MCQRIVGARKKEDCKNRRKAGGGRKSTEESERDRRMKEKENLIVFVPLGKKLLRNRVWSEGNREKFNFISKERKYPCDRIKGGTKLAREWKRPRGVQ